MSKAILFVPAPAVPGTVAAQNAERPRPNDPEAKAKAATAALALLALAGCASLGPDGGFSSVERALAERTSAQAKWVRSEDEADSVRTRVRELLAKPLSAEDAVQIALLNNPGLQAAYAEVGIAEADLVRESRRLRRGEEIDSKRSPFSDVLGLLNIAPSVRGERSRFEAAQRRAMAQALGVAHETRKAWFAAVAAQENANYTEQVKEAAEASAELARRMAALGNLSKLDQAREQAFYAEATAQLARSRHASLAASEHLARQMTLRGEDLGFKLPERLPELPPSPRLDVRVRPEAREAYRAYRTAFDLARHYRDEIVPLRKRISEEMLLRYNGMLASVFELLADSRESAAAVRSSIEALRGFWIAESDLQAALSTAEQ